MTDRLVIQGSEAGRIIVRQPGSADALIYAQEASNSAAAAAAAANTAVQAAAAAATAVTGTAWATDVSIGADELRTSPERAADALNMLDFEATGNDPATKIQKAIDAAAARSGASKTNGMTTVYVVGLDNQPIVTQQKIVMKSGVRLVGLGKPVIQAGGGFTVLEGEDFLTLFDTGDAGGIQNFAIEGIIFDGGWALDEGVWTGPAVAANEGHGVAIYGRAFFVRDIEARNTARRGVVLDYASGANGTSPFDGHGNNILTDRTGEEGVWLTVSDAHYRDINVRSASQSGDNTYDGAYLNRSVRVEGLQVWTGGDTTLRPRYPLNAGPSSGHTMANIVLETGATANWFLQGNRSSITNLLSYNCAGSVNGIIAGLGNYVQGAINASGPATKAVQIGTVGVSAGQNEINLQGTAHADGWFDFVNSAGYNLCQVRCFQNSGVMFAGTRGVNDRLHFMVNGQDIWSGGAAAGAIEIGDNCVASASGALAIGIDCTASFSFAQAFGRDCESVNTNALATGLQSRANLYGQLARSAGQFSTRGDAQSFDLILRNSTTDDTPTVLFLNGSTARAVVPQNTAWACSVRVMGMKSDRTDVYHAIIHYTVKRDTNLNSVALVGTPTEEVISDVVGYDAAVSANTSAGSVDITVTGAAATTVRWVAIMLSCVQIQ